MGRVIQVDWQAWAVADVARVTCGVAGFVPSRAEIEAREERERSAREARARADAELAACEELQRRTREASDFHERWYNEDRGMLPGMATWLRGR